MNKYRVWITVRGAAFRPAYDGYVDIDAETPEDAQKSAVRKLQNTSFRDVWPDAIRVDSIETR